MPIPSPKPQQTESEFLAECISFLKDEGTPIDEAAAICYTKWEEHSNQTEDTTED